LINQFNSSLVARQPDFTVEPATKANSAWPVLSGRHSDYRKWSQLLLGKKPRVLHSSGPCYRDCRVPACWPCWLKSLAA